MNKGKHRKIRINESIYSLSLNNKLKKNILKKLRVYNVIIITRIAIYSCLLINDQMTWMKEILKQHRF